MSLYKLVKILDNLSFVYLGLSVCYLFIFALISRFRRSYNYPESKKRHRFLVLFPAYKEDSVIESSVESFFRQEYPSDHYEIMVISDSMNENTNKKLTRLQIRLLKARFENSTKAKALNFAMDAVANESYDMVIIMDADNTVEPDFLDQINRAYNSGAMAIQAHRKGKNFNTEVAILDAASEEMNNAYFRKGHVLLGLSSALSGSGMAFDYHWFRENIKKVNTAGEDKELEILLLKQRIYIDYLDDVPVYDEKVQNSSAFYNQRQRWLAAQFGSLKKGLKDLPEALFSGNVDYCDKLLQWIILPRLLLLGLILLISISSVFFYLELSIKWWGLLFFLFLTFGLAIPKDLDNKTLEKAIRKIPLLFVLMFINLFRMKGAYKTFGHTEHGQQ